MSAPLDLTPKFPATSTPRFIAEQMLELAYVDVDSRILEPSAGYGDLALVCPTRSRVTCIELNAKMTVHLKSLRFKTYHGDFLSMMPATRDIYNGAIGQFHAVIMCPPLNALAHVQHAKKFLYTDGKGVALVRNDAADWGNTPNIKSVIPLPDIFEYDGQSVPSSIVTF